MTIRKIIKNNWWKYLLFVLLYSAFCIYSDVFRYVTYDIGGQIVQRLDYNRLVPVVILFVAVLSIIFCYDFFKIKYGFAVKLKNGAPFKRYSRIAFIIVPFLVALFQVFSIWHFAGESVDESEIFHYAIGFFGGDFNPHWFGYGSLGMYIVYAVYILAYIPMFIMGKFASLHDYAMQMFENQYFLLLARYVFAVLSVFVVMLYSRSARDAKIPTPVILTYFLFVVTSSDAIFFANYLRTDSLVSFFVALLLFSAYRSKNPKYLYIMALASAGAFASKMSALPLTLLFAGYVLYRLIDKTIKWKHALYLAVTWLALLFIFQPYINYFDIVKQLFALGTQGDEILNLNWGKGYYYSVFDRLAAIWSCVVKYVSAPALFCLPLLVFSRRYIKLLIPAVGALLLLVLPYINSPEITYYWFVPVFGLIYFLALIGVAGFVDFIEALMVNRFKANRRPVRIAVFVAFAMLATGYVIQVHIPGYLKKYAIKERNAQMATKWIEQNLLESERILLEGNYAQANPRVYDRNDLKLSQSISKIFKYNRMKNKFLEDIFYEYLQDRYYQKIGIEEVKGIEVIKYFDVKDTAALNSNAGKYFVTNRNSYNRYIVRKDGDLGDKRKEQLANIKEYYSYMLSQPMVKRFDKGSGPVVEIYYITGNPATDKAK